MAKIDKATVAQENARKGVRGVPRAQFLAMHVTAGDHRRVAAELIRLGAGANQFEKDFLDDMAIWPGDHVTRRCFEFLAMLAKRHGVTFRHA